MKKSLTPHFSKFTNCYSDMVALASPAHKMYETDEDNRVMKNMALTLAIGIREGERFYYPMDSGILCGKEITEEIKALIHLPFGCIAILTEQTFDNDKVFDRITVAFNREFNKKYRIFANEWDLSGFYVTCAHFTETGWIPSPYSAYCELFDSGSGYRITGLHNPNTTFPKIATREMRDDISDVLNLCVMLSLHNVKSVDQQPPLALNKKRISCQRLPLFSYHVLEVAGERWNSRSSGESGSGFRSHMRRGHIRKLDETRKVWVRATMVHGSRPGFVDKEYLVK